LDTPKTKEIIPQKIVIVEGYLLFYLPEVRELLNYLVFLDAPDNTRVLRRTKLKNADYVEHVLLPMHHMYIEPTKKYADRVLDTGQSSIAKTTAEILDAL
jgi:uridine kinase